MDLLLTCKAGGFFIAVVTYWADWLTDLLTCGFLTDLTMFMFLNDLTDYGISELKSATTSCTFVMFRVRIMKGIRGTLW